MFWLIKVPKYSNNWNFLHALKHFKTLQKFWTREISKKYISTLVVFSRLLINQHMTECIDNMPWPGGHTHDRMYRQHALWPDGHCGLTGEVSGSGGSTIFRYSVIKYLHTFKELSEAIFDLLKISDVKSDVKEGELFLWTNRTGVKFSRIPQFIFLKILN